MGEGTRRVATNSSGEGDGLGSCEAHNVGISPQEDRGGTAGKVGEGEGGEEGWLEPAEPVTRIVLHSCSSENYRQLCCLSSMPRVEVCVPVHSSGGPPPPPSKVWLVRLPRSRFLA